MRRNSDWNPFRDLVRKETGDLGLEKALTGELWNDRAVEAVDGSCLSAFESAKGRRRAKAMMIWMLVDIVVIKAESAERSTMGSCGFILCLRPMM